jgi:hypothetical protein
MSKKEDKIKILGTEIEFSAFQRFVVLLILIVFGPVLLIHILGYNDMNLTGGIGDTFNGITAPFISFLSAILVFLAFRAQVNANKIISDQFEEQKKDELFFRLTDSLQNKISNQPAISSEDSSEEFLLNLVKKFHKGMIAQLPLFARQTLARSPEKIEDRFYKDIAQAEYENKKDQIDFKIDQAMLKKILMEYEDTIDRWEYLKNYFNSVGSEPKNQIKVLESIGYVYFYKVPYIERKAMYSSIYSDIKQENGVFIEGYLKIFELLLVHALKKEKRDFYLEYIDANTTTHEKLLIFYYLASEESSDKLRALVKESNILAFNSEMSSFLTDSPSIDDYKKELDNILG